MPLLIRAALETYRRRGADLPFTDPARAHGSPMEGYYWRIVDSAAGRVIAALCGVCQSGEESWAVVALAVHPEGLVRQATVAPAAGAAGGFGVRAANVLDGSLTHLRVHLAADAWIDVALRPRVHWPRSAFGALGPAHVVPGLDQYWHPVLLDAGVDGAACIGGVQVRLDGASAYAEKNWGPRFPEHWWWGHADTFEGGDASVAFSGGPIRLLGATVSPTAVIVRLGTRILRLSPPLARARAAASASGWRIRAVSPGWSVDVEGEEAQGRVLLPVPHLATRTVEMRSVHHLAGRLYVHVRRRARTVFEGESPLAGLERGLPGRLRQ